VTLRFKNRKLLGNHRVFVTTTSSAADGVDFQNKGGAILFMPLPIWHE
jgi:hypothetical protein